ATTGTRTLATTTSVTIASTTEITRPSLTPERNPYDAIASPPNVGAMAIGTRRSTDWTVNPIVRRFFGRASPTTAKSVGLAMLVQAMAKTSPAKTHGHVGAAKKSA